MIIKNKDRPERVKENLCDGYGKAHFTDFCEEGDLPSKCKLATLLTLETGCSIGPHVHDGNTEFYCVVSGEGETSDDGGEKQTLREGDVMLTGGGGSHYIKCISEEPLKLIAIVLHDE